MEKNTIYSTKATASGGRNGKVQTENELLKFETRLPKEMGGENNDYTNPEQLFACAYATCFDGAIGFAAGLNNYEVTSETSVEIHVDAAENSSLNLRADVVADIQGISRKDAEKLLKHAHSICPYSKALKPGMEISVKLK